MQFLAGLILGALVVFFLINSEKNEVRKRLEESEEKNKNIQVVAERYAKTFEIIKISPCKGKRIALLTVDGRKSWYRIKIQKDLEHKDEDVITIMRRATPSEIEDARKIFPAWWSMQVGESTFYFSLDKIFLYKFLPWVG